MRLSVAYTSDLSLIPQLATIPQVKEVYGKLSSDIIGGGRASYMIKNVNFSMLTQAVNEAKKHRIKFNYLLNAANLNGFEQTRAGQRKLRMFLDKLSNIGIEHVTVSIPYLLYIIKSQYPQFKVRVGVFARIASARSARWWENMGADTLCISAISCNRRLDILKEIRESVQCDLQLIVNGCCLQDCPYELSHMNLLTHSSRKGSTMSRFSFDYCFLHCTVQRFRDPSFFLKSIWIRPEDCNLYESIGYDNFKIIDRGCTPQLLLKRARAYADRSFNGNLLELIGPSARIYGYGDYCGFGQLLKLISFAKPWKIRLKSVFALKKFAEETVLVDYSNEKNCPVYIENKLLDGFLESVLQKNCKPRECENCPACRKWMDRAVKVNKGIIKESFNRMELLVDAMNSGTLF